MKQRTLVNDIPFYYLIIGSGRVSTHFSHYLNLLNIPFLTWNRNQPLAELSKKLSLCTHVLILISDSAIEEFAEKHLINFNGYKIHFSGACEFNGLISAHPLMTFGPDLYELNSYERMSFVLTTSLPISEILPGTKNPSFKIDPQQKAFYHALCVYCGNFTTLLWQESFQQFEKLGIPKLSVLNYLEKIADNLKSSHSTVLTGPLARKDYSTIRKNLDSLQNHKMHDVYLAFVKSNLPEAEI